MNSNQRVREGAVTHRAAVIGILASTALGLAGLLVLPPILYRLYPVRRPPGTHVELYVTGVLCIISAGMLWTSMRRPKLWQVLQRTSCVTALKVMALAVLGLGVLNYLGAQVERLRSPFLGSDFGSTLFTHAWRYAEGLPIYCNPEQCPVVGGYNPLYMILTGLIFRLTGPIPLVPKAISAVAVAGTALLIYFHLHTRERDRMAAWLASLAWLAAFEITGRWYDMPRVDPLFTFCWVAGFFLLHAGRGAQFVGITALVLSYWTKQNGLAAVAGGLACLWVLGSRRVSTWLLPAILATVEIAAPWLLLDRSSSGWFKFWTIDIVVVSNGIYQSLSPIRATFLFWTRQAPLWLLTASLARPLSFSERPAIRSWWVMTACALAMGLSGIWHIGGWINSLMPLEAFLCIGVGHAYAAAVRTPQPRLPLWQPAGILFLVIAQGVAWLPFRSDHVKPVVSLLQPYTSDKSLIQLVRSVASYPGDVWAPENPEVAVLAGKPALDSVAYLFDFTRGTRPLPDRLYRMISNRAFGAVLLSEGRRPVQSEQGPTFGRIITEVDPFTAFSPDFVRLFLANYEREGQAPVGWDIYVPRRSRGYEPSGAQ